MKKITVMFAVCMVVLLLAGCGVSKEAEEARAAGIEQMVAGEYEAAVESFEQALDAKKLNSEWEKDIKSYLASAQFQMGDYEAAVNTCETIEDYQNDNDLVYLRGITLGIIAENKEQYEEAAGLYQNLLGLGKDAFLYNRLAVCSLQTDKPEQALECVQSGLALEDEMVMQDLYYHEIIAYERLADYETARDKAAAYVQQYPDDGAAVKEYEFLKTR